MPYTIWLYIVDFAIVFIDIGRVFSFGCMVEQSAFALKQAETGMMPPSVLSGQLRPGGSLISTCAK